MLEKKKKNLNTSNKQKKVNISAAAKRKSYPAVPIVDFKVTFSMNNTIITVVKPNGNKLFACSPPMLGYKGPKKSTPYAARMAFLEALRKVQDLYQTKKINNIYVKGPGSGRDVALKSISGIPVNAIIDVTSFVHNGCIGVRPRSL